MSAVQGQASCYNETAFSDFSVSHCWRAYVDRSSFHALKSLLCRLKQCSLYQVKAAKTFEDVMEKEACLHCCHSFRHPPWALHVLHIGSACM